MAFYRLQEILHFIFEVFVCVCGYKFPWSNYEKNPPKKERFSNSPTVSQGSSLWTQKSVLERENKTREKHRQVLDNRKANQMRSILFLQHSNEIRKSSNGDSFSDFSAVNLTFVSSRVSETSKMSQNEAQTPHFAVRSQRSYYEQTFLIISSSNESIMFTL